MTDYLGPLTIGVTNGGAYTLTKWEASSSDSGAAVDLEIIVRGTSSDTLAIAMEALVAQLRQGNAYAHFQPGVTNPVVYWINGVTNFKQDAYVSWEVYWQRVTFTLSIAVAPQGALVAPYNATATLLPTSVSLSTLLGTNPTPIDVTIDDTSGNDMHSIWAALAPTALSDTKWKVLASAITWTTMSNGTGATMWGNVERHTIANTYQTGLLDTSLYPTGKYRLLARVCQDAGTGFIKDSQNDDAIAITRTTPYIVVIGDLDLPVSDTAPGVASNLTISVKSDGTNTCTLNALILLPLEYGYFSWHPLASTTEIDQLDVGPSGIYMDGTCDTTYLQGSILVPRTLASHTNTLVVTPSPTGTTWPNDWGRSGIGSVTAVASTFKLVTTGADTWASYADTVLGCPLVVPGAWYELDVTQNLSSRTNGNAYVGITWLDIDGNQVRVDVLSTTISTGSSNLELYAKAPMHASRAQVVLGTSGSATLTVAFSNVVLRRCPLRLIVVAEDADGTLASNTHAVALTVKYTPRYEIAR